MEKKTIRPKLNDKQKKRIVADYYENQNYSLTARNNGVSLDTVRKLVMKDENYVQKLAQKKEENTLSTLEYMQTQHETKKRILDKILKGIEIKAEDVDMFTNIKDLATAYGIILDKELKLLELRRNSSNNEDLNKVRELLSKIEDGVKDE